MKQKRESSHRKKKTKYRAMVREENERKGITRKREREKEKNRQARASKKFSFIPCSQK